MGRAAEATRYDVRVARSVIPVVGRGFSPAISLGSHRHASCDVGVVANRRPLRLPSFTYTGFNRYFLTLCTYRRRHHFAADDVVESVLPQMRRAALCVSVPTAEWVLPSSSVPGRPVARWLLRTGAARRGRHGQRGVVRVVEPPRRPKGLRYVLPEQRWLSSASVAPQIRATMRASASGGDPRLCREIRLLGPLFGRTGAGRLLQRRIATSGVFFVTSKSGPWSSP